MNRYWMYKDTRPGDKNCRILKMITNLSDKHIASRDCRTIAYWILKNRLARLGISEVQTHRQHTACSEPRWAPLTSSLPCWANSSLAILALWNRWHISGSAWVKIIRRQKACRLKILRLLFEPVIASSTTVGNDNKCTETTRPPMQSETVIKPSGGGGCSSRRLQHGYWRPNSQPSSSYGEKNSRKRAGRSWDKAAQPTSSPSKPMSTRT